MPDRIKHGMERAGDILKGNSLSLWEQETTDEVELAFLCRQLIQITLPHSDPGDVPVWVRQNGNLMLVLSRTNVDQHGKVIGYPFGSLPRLLLYWLNSEVVRTKDRRIELGNNLSQFMFELGLNPRNGRGERSDAKRLRDQIDRLFSASIRFKRVTEGRKQDIVEPIVSKSDLWWDAKRPRQGYLWNSWIELGENFYKTLIAAPVPLNMTALKALKRSPLALDLYSWICYRSWGATRLGKVQSIPWEAIHGQLGSDYADMDDFRTKAKKALLKIVTVQPELRVSVSSDCLEIKPSQPIISAKARL